jgi:hypothetical protein
MNNIVSIRIRLSLIKICLVVVFNSLWVQSFAHVNPENGSTLSQIQVMFEWDNVNGADQYEFTIFTLKDEQRVEHQVYKKIVKTISCLVKDSLSFGKMYQWQVKAINNNQKVISIEKYNFSILFSPQISSQYFKTEILKSSTSNQDIIFIDHNALAIDKSGKPVWFLPIPYDSLYKRVIRDLKMNSFGTITHLDFNGVYEKQLDGKMQWNKLNNEMVAGVFNVAYHHDLKKMNDGSYVVCGSNFEANKFSNTKFDASTIKYNSLIHYNNTGSLRWKWDELESLQNDSIFKNNAYQSFAGHLNGFAFTKQKKRLWMSFKNYSDVFLLDVDSKKIIGSLQQKGSTRNFDFKQQHGPYITKNDEILIYNNNISDQEKTVISHPSIMLFSYDENNRKTQLNWEYTLKSDKFPNGIIGKEGYASETPSGNFLVCAGGANYTVEITRAKKKIWECFFYKRSPKDTTWQPFSNYRCQASSSLYPLYFTLQLVSIQNQYYLFQFNNVGSEQGQFRIEFANSNGESISKKKAVTLAAGASYFFKVPKKQLIGKQIQCFITPTHINGYSKQYSFSL